MKVIKKQDVSGWSYKHICKNCDSELEVEPKDLKYTYYPGDQRDPSYESYDAQCQVCDKSFTVPKDKIPKLIQLEAQKKPGSVPYYTDR